MSSDPQPLRSAPRWSSVRTVWRSRSLLLHLGVPLLFATLYTVLTDLPATAVHFSAAALTAILIMGAYTGPAFLVRRHGAVRGLILAALTGALVGSLLGLLGTGVPPRGADELTALGSWVLVGVTAPIFGFALVRSGRVLFRLPGNLWRWFRSVTPRLTRKNLSSTKPSPRKPSSRKPSTGSTGSRRPGSSQRPARPK